MVLNGLKIHLSSTNNFIKSYNEDSDIGYFIEADVQYPEELHGIHNDLPFWPNRMNIEKVEKRVAKMHDTKENAIHIINSKQALNHGLILKKVHRVIKFKQEAWQKPSYEDRAKKKFKK